MQAPIREDPFENCGRPWPHEREGPEPEVWEGFSFQMDLLLWGGKSASSFYQNGKKKSAQNFMVISARISFFLIISRFPGHFLLLLSFRALPSSNCPPFLPQMYYSAIPCRKKYPFLPEMFVRGILRQKKYLFLLRIQNFPGMDYFITPSSLPILVKAAMALSKCSLS